ncbi:MAG: amidohydrolase family protein [Oscillospiraceae bacterium]|nr:amidohydrolase family protein [Oscillospiraceae bacterium]
MKADLLLKNGTIVTHTSRFEGSIAVKDGKIAALLAKDADVESARTVDVAGKYIIPGMIDTHTHVEDPGCHIAREDMPHATSAAAIGGVTTMCVMPTNDPLLLNEAAYQAYLDAYKSRANVDYTLYGGLDSTNIHSIRDLWKNTGVSAMKVYMCYSSPNMGFVDDELLYDAMEILAPMNAVLIAHCENDGLINLMTHRIEAAGRTDYMSFNESRPALGEEEAIRRLGLFARHTGMRVVVPHLSTAEGILAVRREREDGADIWAETCPQYFELTTKDHEKLGPFTKFSPVMHDQANQDRMWELIGKGYIDVLGSDHSPYELSEKLAGKENIWKAPNGMPGLQTEMAVWLHNVNKGRITLEDFVRMSSYNAAKLFRLPGKGDLLPGYDADIVVVDMDAEHALTEEEAAFKCKWSPLMGRKYKGWPVMTFLRGELVAKDYHFVGKTGSGKFIPRAN